ncbi:hypothetical protein AHAS_Ahas19G0080800 [Arachis hypogaea]
MVAEEYISDNEFLELGVEDQAPFNPIPNIETMERWINRRWANKENIRVMDLEGGRKNLDTMLRVGELTSILSRGKLSCICMEINLRKQLVPSFMALEKEFQLIYEGLHQICFYCGIYGHRVDGCPDVKK